MDWILDETQLVVSTIGDMSSRTVDVSSCALMRLMATSCPILLSTKEFKLYYCIFAKVCARVYGIFSFCFWHLLVLQKQVVTLATTQRQEK